MSDSETSKPRSNKSNRRSLLKWIKRSLWIAAALGLLAMIVVAFLPKPVLVDVVEVERGALRVTVDEDGRSRVSDRYVLSAPLTGNLGRIELDPGDDVGEGEVIARLVPLARPLMDAQSRAEAEARVAAAAAQLRQARASVERGRAALAFADTQVGRQRQLMARGTVAQVALDRAELEHRSRREEVTSAEFGVRVAAHQLEMARAALGRFDGLSFRGLPALGPLGRCCRRRYALIGFDRRTFGKYGDAKVQAGRQCALRTAKHVEGKGIVVGH
mgnify:CR=1 FL=1